MVLTVNLLRNSWRGTASSTSETSKSIVVIILNFFNHTCLILLYIVIIKLSQGTQFEIETAAAWMFTRDGDRPRPLA